MKKRVRSTKMLFSIIVTVVAFMMSATSVFAWFYMQRDLAAYAPISTPESLYIGAGHYDIEGGYYEDIRYLYFDAMDTHPDGNNFYWDKVFCIYGKRVRNYKIQLAFTTNNQFTYQLFNADEYDGTPENPSDYVSYTAHDENETVYYYSARNNTPIAGIFLNEDGESTEAIATSALHDVTYVDDNNSVYDISKVNKYAEPLYWQTANKETGHATQAFANYYILRIYITGKITYNRETDIICISAKTA